MYALTVLVLVPVILCLILLIPVVQTAVVKHLTIEISEELNAKISIGKVSFRPFKSLVLNDVIIYDQQKDTLLSIDQLTTSIDSIYFKRREVYFAYIKADKPKIHVAKQDSVYNYEFLTNAFKPRADRLNNVPWKVNLNAFQLSGGELNYDEKHKSKQVDIKDLNISINEINKDSLWHFSVNKLAFKNSIGININGAKGDVSFSKQNLILKSFHLETEKSFFEVDSLYFKVKLGEEGMKRIERFYFDLVSSRISSEELALVTPLNTDVKLPLKLKGRIYGSMDNIKGQKVICNFGPYSQVKTSFDINGLPNQDEAFMYINVSELKTVPNDLEKLLSLSQGEALILPTAFRNLNQIKYSGSFTGFLTDLVAYGEFNTSLGSIKTDIGLKMGDENDLIFSGNISTESFNIGKLANAEEYIKNVSMSVAIKGKRKAASDYSAFLSGVIDTLTVNNYNYKNIKLNGLFANDKFDGDFLIDDPNGQLGFNGKVDLSGAVPNYNFNAHLTAIRLDQLNIAQQYNNSFLTADVETNFSGSDLDDIVGFINIRNVEFESPQHDFQIDSLLLLSEREGNRKRIVLQSDIAEGDLVGVYNFTHASSMIKRDLIKYLPSLSAVINVKDTVTKVNDFTFSCTLKRISKLASFIVPGLEVSDKGLILGTYNSADQRINLEAEVEHINYKGIKTRYPELHLKAGSNNKLVLITRLRNLNINNAELFQNLSLHHTAYNDTLQFNTFWNNWEEYTNSGSILTTTSLRSNAKGVYATVDLKPSYIMVRDSLWEIQSTRMHYHPDGFSLKYFRIHHGNQEIGINGFAHRHIDDGLKVHIQNIGLSDIIGSQNLKQVQVAGALNGTLDIQQVYNSPVISGELSINKFNFNNDELGNFSLRADYKPKQNVIQIHSDIIKDGLKPMNGGGFIDLADKSVDLQYDIDSLEIGFLNLYLSKVMQNLSGTASGQLSVKGPLSTPELLGRLKINKAFFDVGLLKTTYSISDSVLFTPKVMEFKELQLLDRNGNKGMFKGTIEHEMFRNMKYNLSLISNEMLVLDTKSSDNQRYYGEVYADGNLSVRGTTNDLIIDIAGTTRQNTDFFIPLTDDESAEESNFIRFVQPVTGLTEASQGEITVEDEYEVDLTGMTISMDLDITPAARCQVIFDSTVGDILKGRGRGNLQIKMDKEGGINFYGDFNFEEGDYMFTLQNVLNKKFVINQGSMIRWDGNPYDADIDLNATYKLKTSLLDLIGNSDVDAEKFGRRIPVNCNLLLTDRLTKPNVQFEIKTPSTQDNNQNIIDTYINTEEETNRQVLSLLVLNRFYSQENSAENNNTNNMSAGNNAALVTTTEMLSNQLSHWLSQISSDFDIGVSYRPAGEMTDDEVEVALSTQMFNNRVTVNGNVGYGEDQTRPNNLIGDFDVEVKLNNSGSIRAKAYTRNNNDLVYSTYTTSPTTQGIGISFKEEFNTLEELMQRYWMKITGKKPEKEIKTEEETKD